MYLSVLRINKENRRLSRQYSIFRMPIPNEVFFIVSKSIVLKTAICNSVRNKLFYQIRSLSCSHCPCTQTLYLDLQNPSNSSSSGGGSSSNSSVIVVVLVVVVVVVVIHSILKLSSARRYTHVPCALH
jgi:hypothetical protein